MIIWDYQTQLRDQLFKVENILEARLKAGRYESGFFILVAVMGKTLDSVSYLQKLSKRGSVTGSKSVECLTSRRLNLPDKSFFQTWRLEFGFTAIPL